MISIIIPTLNDRLNLSNLFNDISKQTLKPFEIICVDGGSTDGTIELAQSNGQCIVKPSNGINNTLLCTNIGANHSTGDILFFTGADVRISCNTISTIQNEFKSNIIALTGMPIPYDGNVICRFEYATYYLLASLLSKCRFITSGSFLAVRKSAFDGFPYTYNGDGNLGRLLHMRGKTKFKHDLIYHVSARRFNKYGFFKFNKEYLYTIENFIPQLDMSRFIPHVKSPSH